MAFLLPDGRQLYYVTIATSYVYNLHKLQAFTAHFGCRLFVLGLNDPEICKKGFAMGEKLLLVQKFLASDPRWPGQSRLQHQTRGDEEKEKEKEKENPSELRFNDDDILFHTDATDVIFNTDSLAKIYEAYLSYECDILFGGERNLAPNRAMLPYTPPTLRTRRYKYLNAGVWIGRIGAIRYYLENYPFDHFTDDQGWWSARFLQQYYPVWKGFVSDDKRYYDPEFVRKLGEREGKARTESETSVVIREDFSESQIDKEPRIAIDTELKFAANFLPTDCLRNFQGWNWEEGQKRWGVQINTPPNLFWGYYFSLPEQFQENGVIRHPCVLHFPGFKVRMLKFANPLMRALRLEPKYVTGMNSENWGSVLLGALFGVTLVLLSALLITYVYKYRMALRVTCK